MTNLIVHHDFDPYYHAMYIKGLHDVLGPGGIRYSFNDFPRSFVHRLAFIVDGRRPCKVFVCHSDYPDYDAAALEWCDVYAKINIDPARALPQTRPYVLPIGPSFGIRIYPALVALGRALRSFRWWDGDPREHFANYYRQRRYRLPEEAYRPGESCPNYLFFAGSLWHDDPETNDARAAFIEAGRQVAGLTFEGGFSPRPRRGDDPPGYEALTMPRPYPFGEYLDKTQRSVVAFNTPAVGGCLGWKLGEFLALGKAIISTPLQRVLPAPLEHGKHVHYVSRDRDDMRAAIDLIRSDTAYRRTLETGARRYYLDYLRPGAVVSHMLRAAQELSMPPQPSSEAQPAACAG
jgi:hypothetical protein